MNEVECPICGGESLSLVGLPRVCTSCIAEYQATPEGRRKQRTSELKSKYGISPEDYETMVEEQSGVCAICFNPPTTRRLSIDHDHETSRIRGLLCSTCNLMLGCAKDSTDILTRAVEYLKVNGDTL